MKPQKKSDKILKKPKESLPYGIPVNEGMERIGSSPSNPKKPTAQELNVDPEFHKTVFQILKFKKTG